MDNWALAQIFFFFLFFIHCSHVIHEAKTTSMQSSNVAGSGTTLLNDPKTEVIFSICQRRQERRCKEPAITPKNGVFHQREMVLERHLNRIWKGHLNDVWNGA